MRAQVRSGQSVQYLNKMGHGQNLRSTSGELEFVARLFFEVLALHMQIKGSVERIAGGGS
jgi:hypothetical protein